MQRNSRSSSNNNNNDNNNNKNKQEQQQQQQQQLKRQQRNKQHQGAGAGHLDLAPHWFDYPVADSGRKGKIKKNHRNGISLMGMQRDLSVPSGLARLAPYLELLARSCDAHLDQRMLWSRTTISTQLKTRICTCLCTCW
ncbi:unnamed protein product [Polarella glacialis]|uniref:Uncharacterized protein n=1 Tax=Polarella glacialis TaxID=89957 RepID=A0A813FNW7_POLGL|nr:unnamed protein product [Polarella glacialis]CAE8631301.1 unnamed protein product [Polarella glacialis]